MRSVGNIQGHIGKKRLLRLGLGADPADRLIGATALQLGARLITADAKLRALPQLDTLW